MEGAELRSNTERGTATEEDQLADTDSQTAFDRTASLLIDIDDTYLDFWDGMDKFSALQTSDISSEQDREAYLKEIDDTIGEFRVNRERFINSYTNLHVHFDNLTQCSTAKFPMSDPKIPWDLVTPEVTSLAEDKATQMRQSVDRAVERFDTMLDCPTDNGAAQTLKAYLDQENFDADTIERLTLQAADGAPFTLSGRNASCTLDLTGVPTLLLLIIQVCMER
jgi:hypothetical protein